MSLLHERIKQKLDELNLKNADLARAMKVSPVAARKWIIGESIPTALNLKKIADYLKVSDDWLLTGKEPTAQKQSTKKETNDINSKEKIQDLQDVDGISTSFVPILTWEQLRKIHEMSNFNPKLIEPKEKLPRPPNASDKSFYLAINDVSNAPHYNNGEYICIEPCKLSDVQTGEMVVIKHHDEPIFRCLIRVDNKNYLQPLNENLKQPAILFDEDCLFIGKCIYSLKPATRYNPSINLR